jgi:hypothetical protein
LRILVIIGLPHFVSAPLQLSNSEEHIVRLSPPVAQTDTSSSSPSASESSSSGAAAAASVSAATSAATAAAAAAFYSSSIVPPNHFLYSQWLATRNTSALFGLQGMCKDHHNFWQKCLTNNRATDHPFTHHTLH